MTGHQIDNFVGSLVEMAKAFEERPRLEQRIAELEPAKAALEDSNSILRQHIDELNAKLAEVSKERDDASFRVLEVEDKASRVLDLAKTLQTGLGQVIAEVEPPKPELVPEVMTWGRDIGPDPLTDATSQPVTAEVTIGSQSASEGQATGQSESDPIASGSASPTIGSVSASSETAQTAESAASASPDKPYAGRRWSELAYHEKPYSFDAWIAGGGTYESWNA